MEKIILDIFNDINDCVFSGVLDTPEIYTGESEELLGAYFVFSKAHDDMLFISETTNIDYFDVFTTVAHEMCHQAQYRLDGLHWSKVNHSMSFKKWASQICSVYRLTLDDII